MFGAAGARPFPADRSVIGILPSTLLRTSNFFRKQSFETDILSGEKNWNVRRERTGTGRPKYMIRGGEKLRPLFAMNYV